MFQTRCLPWFLSCSHTGTRVTSQSVRQHAQWPCDQTCDLVCLQLSGSDRPGRCWVTQKSQTPLSFDLNHRSYLRSPVHHPGALLFPCFLHFLVYLAPGCRSLCLLLSHISVFCFVLLFLVKGQNFKMKSPVCLNTVELINKSHLLTYLRYSWRAAQVWISLNASWKSQGWNWQQF